MPSRMSRSDASACNEAAAMASNGGVRTCTGTTPVPSPTPGVIRDTAPSTENASTPVTSATQTEP